MPKINIGLLVAICMALSFIAVCGKSTCLQSESELLEATIENIKFGELLMGDALTQEDLQGRVVGVKFWGKWLGVYPATTMPRTVEWDKKYGPNGLVLIGFHGSKDPETAKEVTAYCRSIGLTYPIYEGGCVSGVQIQIYPHFVLFDHTGQMIYSGHPMQAEGKLAAAMKAAPDWLTGPEPYKKLKALADKIKERKELGKTLAALKTKHLNSADAEEKAEAEKLIGKLSRYGNQLLQKAAAKKDTEPLNSHNLYQEAARLFKGDDIGDKADSILTELKDDKTFQDNLKAEKELADMIPEIDKLKACNKCGTFNQKCADCKKKNQSLETLVQKARGLVKKYPDSPAAVKVKELLPIE
ncbi:MAG: hypothetical protein HZA49_02110 [Planctomycetes bacterium]|nr:hypothetical protein [Planctomycetota bacterium]